MFTVLDTPTSLVSKRSRDWLERADYHLCESLGQLDDYIGPAIEKKDPIGLDWETTSLNVWKAKCVGLAVSTSPYTGLYVPVRHFVGSELNLPLDEVIARLKYIDSIEGLFQLWFNFKYDGSVMRHDEGVRWMPSFGKFLDVLYCSKLYDGNEKVHGLKDVVAREMGIEMLEYSDVVGEGQGFHMIHPRTAVPYACPDADFCRQLFYHKRFVEAVREQQQIWKLENQLIIPIMDGIDNGVPMDLLQLKLLEYSVAAQLVELHRDIYASMGVDPTTFNLNSRPQVGRRLIELGVPIEERTKGGVNSAPQVATGKDILVKYESDQFPFIKKLIMRAELQTQLTNYIRKMIGAREYFGTIVRYAFNQLGAPTGRMSSGGEGKKGEAAAKGYVNVNVQSLPDHEKQPYLPNIRSSIIANDLSYIDNLVEPFIYADTGGETLTRTPTYEQPYECEEWVIVSIDFSQIELRVAGNLSREPEWIDAFNKGMDIHQKNAQLAYADPSISKDDPRRKQGKTMGFAILFQAHADTVAKHGNISEDKAQELIDTFLGKVKRLNEWIENTKLSAKGLGKVKTFFGRVRKLGHYFEPGAPRGVIAQGEREAVNTPIQGTAADIFKIACCRVWKLIQSKGWTNDVLTMLWVHDEIVFRVRRSVLYDVVPALIGAMEFPVADWPIPIVAKPYVGWNLGTLYDYDDWVRMFPPETVGQHVVTWLPAAVYGDALRPPTIEVEEDEAA